LMGATKIGRRWAFYALAATVLGAGVGCLVGNVYTAWEETRHGHAGGEHADEEHGAGEHEEEVAATHTEHEASVTSETTDAADEVEETMPGAVVAPSTTTEFTEEAPEYGGEGPKFPGVFFSIYYAMTGVHAIHILGGIGVFVWIVSRAARGHFEPTYYGPVEYVGLYWHLVDLIWIYLFPLLYLIE
jgi:cytochrome c oxidase subunit III